MADSKNKTLRPSLNLFFLHTIVLFLFLLLLLILPSASHQSPTPDRQKRQTFDFSMNKPSTENNVSNSNGTLDLPPITNAGSLAGSLGDLFNISLTETNDAGTGWPGLASDNCPLPCRHGVCNYTDEEKTKMSCVCDPGYVGVFCVTPSERTPIKRPFSFKF
ncbi:hypothetical protein V1264_023542 [Littorina saxatilis]|uniref:EGF-like domain-containing protein n=1 Tax=Littorina saxatilis TaxID=31220 RepID=A0AAN9G9H8_9CAEN